LVELPCNGGSQSSMVHRVVMIKELSSVNCMGYARRI
jgi:hypothetical protein